MPETLMVQRIREMNEKMQAHITQHPHENAYTFQVHRDDLRVAHLVGAALCAEILKPIQVMCEQEEEHEHPELLFS